MLGIRKEHLPGKGVKGQILSGALR